jgi:hypothetical protein
MQNHRWKVTTSRDFEELLSEVDHRDSLRNEELIDQIANMWMKKNNYTPKIITADMDRN